MEAVSYSLLVIAIAWVVVWFFTNDRKRPGEPTTGFFAMRREAAEEAEAKNTKGRPTRNGRR